jgi:type VI secretion system protein ImpB
MDQGTATAGERLHIVYRNDANEELELPLRMLFVGDFMGRDERPIEDRVPVRIDRDSFAKVLAALAPRLDLVVGGAGPEGASAVRASLVFRRLSDFGPDGIAPQIPEVTRRLAVRSALTELKTTGDVPAFRARLETLVDEPGRARLLAALGLGAP